MYFDYQGECNYEWSPAQTATFNRCIDFIAKMVEKYGNAISLGNPIGKMDCSERDPRSEPGAVTFRRLRFLLPFPRTAG